MRVREGLLLLALYSAPLLCQTAPDALPAGTPLALTLDQNCPMRVHAPLRAHLMYPIYGDNQLLLPKDTIITGTVVQLLPDRKRRIHAELGGDLTPFRIPEVRFSHILLPDGTAVPLSTGPASNGAPVFRAVAPPPVKGGFVHREFDFFLNSARGDLAFYIAPGKGDRFLQFLYDRLPYHPQHIAKGTSWTVETTAAVQLPAEAASLSPADLSQPIHKHHFWDQPAPPASSAAPRAGVWIVQANLAENLSSEVSKSGRSIKAIVAEPVYDSHHTLVVPQGATLVGEVTRAKPARHFGRSGVLSFNFRQITMPNAATQTVETRLTGADSAQDIALNSEGQAGSKPQDKLIIPLVLVFMAARPLDQDSGRAGAAGQPGRNGIGGAAGLGLVGTIVGLAGGSPYAAAAIGYWGAARAVYARWIGRGQTIAFPKDTRIVVETTPRRSAPITDTPPPAN